MYSLNIFFFFVSHNSQRAVGHQCFHTILTESSRHLPRSECTYVIRQDSTPVWVTSWDSGQELTL